MIVSCVPMTTPKSAIPAMMSAVEWLSVSKGSSIVISGIAASARMPPVFFPVFSFKRSYAFPTSIAATASTSIAREYSKVISPSDIS